MKGFTIKRFSENAYLVGIALLAIGLPMGKIFMSLGGFFILGSFLLHGDFKTKLNAFASNRSAILLTSLFFLYLIGSIYSPDWNSAKHTLRMVVPLLIMPLVFSSMPVVNEKKLFVILHIFIGGVLLNSFISMTKNQGESYRDIVMFVSRIRYALMAVLSIHITLYYSIKKSWGYKIFGIVSSIWLVYFMNIIESGTGFVLLVSTSLISLFFLSRKKHNSKFNWILSSILILGIFSSIFFVYSSYNHYFEIQEYSDQTSETKTKKGESYAKINSYGTLENGYLLWRFYAPKETKAAWNSISPIKYDDLDSNGYPINGTLIRYLTSKGLRKDYEGVMELTENDILNIQSGETNYLSKNQSGVKRRLNEIFYELDRYNNGYDPSQNPTISRLFYWTAAYNVFKQNWEMGVGTGGVKSSIASEYERLDSPLSSQGRKLVHNQYLTMGVQFGIFGLIWFLVVVFYPFFIRDNIYPSVLFLFIFILSCISEDTLNTQAGITFFVFFYSLFFVRNRVANSVH